jgi:hypothetical protein
MQVDLVNYRKTTEFVQCSKTHKEWFDVTKSKAMAVLGKWRDWTLLEPYAEDDEGNWTLKPEFLDNVCNPTIEESQATAQSRGVRTRSERSTLRRSAMTRASRSQ